MKYDQKIKQLEKFLIIKKVSDNPKFGAKQSNRLIIREQAMKARQNELQDAVNRNFDLLGYGYEFNKVDKKNALQTEKFLKHFLDLDNEEDHLPKINKHQTTRTELTQISTEERFPQMISTIPTLYCNQIMKSCETVKGDIKKLKRVNKKTIKTNQFQMNKMLNRLVTIQTTNFLNNELILL
ncbi:unnamed protein product [Paramecium primaurelia]|uniref:Uncharacterized protein n=2 Tax=Paramecium TaxID=5884 RepID=A0A8S1UKF8_9CILI|nr:unnamed protein product [Paramecium primaurelia]CAD8164935.1 unnamed protein product [Paramecium pentaurelia]